jgi:hypothetical protein
MHDHSTNIRDAIWHVDRPTGKKTTTAAQSTTQANSLLQAIPYIAYFMEMEDNIVPANLD